VKINSDLTPNQKERKKKKKRKGKKGGDKCAFQMAKDD